MTHPDMTVTDHHHGVIVAASHRGSAAIQAMIESAPATGSLALWAQHRDVDVAALSAWFGTGVALPDVATDGFSLFYAPAFEQRSEAEQIGLVAHATLHLALRHPQRRALLAATLGQVDPVLFNLCADALVNTMLGHIDWLTLPAGSVCLETLLAEVMGQRCTAEQALIEWDVERLYRQIDDRQTGAGASGREQGKVGHGREASGRRSGVGSATADAALTDGPRAAAARRLAQASVPDLLSAEQVGCAAETDRQAEPDLARQWGERLQRAHAGDGQFSLLRSLGAELADRRTPWEVLLRSQISRGLSPQPALSWSRPSRSWLANRGRTRSGHRLPWEPGMTSARSVPRLVLVLDVSASIDAVLLGRFSAELQAITRRCQAEFVLIAGDTDVREVQRLAPGGRRLLPADLPGGGGTDFTPLLLAAHAERPDLCLVLTDLDGPLRFTPPWPLIWAVPPGWTGRQPDCGRVIELA